MKLYQSMQGIWMNMIEFLRLTDEGVFGSKFVTICVTGNKENEVHMEGYQVNSLFNIWTFRDDSIALNPWILWLNKKFNLFQW